MRCEMCGEEMGKEDSYTIKIDENGDFLSICLACYMGTQE